VKLLDKESRKVLDEKGKNQDSEEFEGFELQLRGLYNNKCVYHRKTNDWWIYFDNDEWKFVEGDDGPFCTFLPSYNGPSFVPQKASGRACLSAAGRLAGWLAGLLAGWLAGWLVAWLACWPAGWLKGWLAGWLVCWPLGSLCGQFFSTSKDSMAPPAGRWTWKGSDRFQTCSIEVIRKDNPDQPPKNWSHRDWLNGIILSCTSTALQYRDATEDSVLSSHEGVQRPEGQYKTLLDETHDQWSSYADSVLLLADFNRMASVVSMKTAYNKGKLDYYLSRDNFDREGPAFGVLKRVIKLTYHKTLLYGVLQLFSIQNFQLTIFNMTRVIRGSVDWFHLLMVMFGLVTYVKAFVETYQTVMWVSEALVRPANRQGFNDAKEGEGSRSCKSQLQQQMKFLYGSLAIYCFFGLILIWKFIQSFTCPQDTVGGFGVFFAPCLPVQKCCQTTCCDKSFLSETCSGTEDMYTNMSLSAYMNQTFSVKCRAPSL
jgi:hypothetical protein